ncbi:uncharacterized protein [Littorina saxatilis]|uniref:Uncharacterized protein n=1 Tax=Littorina saxatilis TaxID=31220 RepID=A0AAN9GB29_9CAEN
MDVIFMKRVTSSTVWTTFVIWSAAHIVVTVKSDDNDDDHTTTRNSEDDHCGGNCSYGCCGNNECCDSSGSIPSYTVQIIAVVGAFLVSLVLLVLCFVRYHCVNKIRTRNGQRRGNNQRSGRNSSVFTLNVPRQNMERLFNALSNWEWPANQGAQPVQPPPYSEHDPVSSPDSPENNAAQSDLPPAYRDVVKDTVIVVPVPGETEISTQAERSGNSGERSEHSGERSGNSGERSGNSGERSGNSGERSENSGERSEHI